MPHPVARSRDEALLFMDLHPCAVCQHADVAWQSALTSDDGAPARRYFGQCPQCGADREFVFRLPARPHVPRQDDLVFFGGPEPSELFDPGEWWLIADVGIRDGSAPRDRAPAADAERRESFALAVAAFGEILKFIPDGLDEVPRSAFRSAHGRAAYERDPTLFRRERLERWRDGFQVEMDDRFGPP